MIGAICGGGDPKAAWEIIKKAKCKNHKRRSAKCEGCKQAFADELDTRFMTIMGHE